MHTHIYTIRHAKTSFGEEHRYAGTMDVPLSPRGLKEAKVSARALRNMKFDVVLTSMKIRAIDTARILVGDTTPLVSCHLCDERNFGAMEGHTALEVKHFKPRILFIKVGNDTHSVNPLGGEPFEDVRERAKRLRRLVFRRYRGSSILIVSHGTFLQQFHGLLRGKSCIESLADWTSDLEMTSFTFSGNRLTEERTAKLAGADRLDW
ncbi:MAG TPA: histidine phosphatase family protein [Candidatus Krumholzibacteriaceae bacterium]